MTVVVVVSSEVAWLMVLVSCLIHSKTPAMSKSSLSANGSFSSYGPSCFCCIPVTSL